MLETGFNSIKQNIRNMCAGWCEFTFGPCEVKSVGLNVIMNIKNVKLFIAPKAFLGKNGLTYRFKCI